MNNPLLSNLNDPKQTIPFKEIKPEHFEPAILKALEIAKEEIKEITDNSEQPNFRNTIVALERSGRQLGLLDKILSNLCSAESTDELQEISEKASPLITKFHNDVSLNVVLFNRIKKVHEQFDPKQHSGEDARLLDQTFKSFVRNGALLTEDKKEELRKIDEKLAILKIKFGQNVLKATNAFVLNLTQKEQTEGLPEAILKQARKEAKARNQEGWTFTLQAPSYLPFLKFSKHRELREQLYKAYGSRCLEHNEFNNLQILRDLVGLRNQRAKLLGFKHHADFVLAERMAGNTRTVEEFLNNLLEKAHPFGVRDVEAIKEIAREDGIKEFMPYDHAYYTEQLREKKFSYSEEALKPYFPLNQVLEAAFEAAGKLYGLSYTERKDIQVYHPEVRVFEVTERGVHKGVLYVDFYPRPGKRPGAWMTDFKGQYIDEAGNHRPQISIVCNFSRPGESTPALLTFGEVTTLFHEFGHSLHGILADTRYESLSGTNVFWDFVELPSQFMENFCVQKEFLTTFARHYQTGAILPDSEIDKIIATSNFMEGYLTIRQLSFGLLDMAYHTGKLTPEDSIEDFEHQVMKPTQLYPYLKGTAMSPSFGHIFSGGYAAGYYSYKWSEVLDADAFSLFKETGIFNPQTAQKFKTLLSKGGTEDPMKLFVDFRGRKPDITALLERAGLRDATKI